ncbi:MAG: phosphatidate cytidylyltransferase [Planctomycetes bacterium]|nr:phosphatidate cytidylyltransferase [Planctomycetota bacterium]
MGKRIAFGTIMVAALAALFVWDHHVRLAGMDGWPLAGLAAVLIAGGYLEYARLAEAAELPAIPLVGIPAAVAVALLPVWAQPVRWPGSDLLLLVLAAAVAATFLTQMAVFRRDRATRRIAGTLLGVLYLGALAGGLLAVRVRFGTAALVWVLAVIKGMDIGAYFAGTAIGRHKIIPWLSPGKSWEGLAGGLVLTAAAAAALNWTLRLGLPMAGAVAGAMVLAVVGQAGDLCESLLKRDAGMKDSAALIPAFGGVLDVVDSPLLAAPAGYVLLAVLS